MAVSEANVGEFSLVFNGPNGPRPVLLTKEKHQLLQSLMGVIGHLYIVENTIVVYEQHAAEEEHF